MAQHDSWVIIPIYNEEVVVGHVVREVRRAFSNIVCVDDGSSDASACAAAQAGAHLVQHPVNLGQGAALQSGIEYARTQEGAQYFVTFDADGQHQVDDAVRLVSALRRGESDIVIGSRFRDSRTRVPLMRRILLRTVVQLSPKIRRLGLTDAHNGLRAFTRPVAQEMTIRRHGMGHASEIVELIYRSGWRVIEQPVKIVYTAYAQAKGQSLINGVNIAFEGFARMGKLKR